MDSGLVALQAFEPLRGFNGYAFEGVAFSGDGR